MPIVYQVIGKVAVCAVVCITVMDSARSTSINEHGCNFSCAVIVRYIARDPARQLRDACVTREVRLGYTTPGVLQVLMPIVYRGQWQCLSCASQNVCDGR